MWVIMTLSTTRSIGGGEPGPEFSDQQKRGIVLEEGIQFTGTQRLGHKGVAAAD